MANVFVMMVGLISVLFYNVRLGYILVLLLRAFCLIFTDIGEKDRR